MTDYKKLVEALRCCASGACDNEKCDYIGMSAHGCMIGLAQDAADAIENLTSKRCDHNKNGEFPSWCPIICQLPEGHGRLIDADELKQHVRNVVREIVDNQPTIVPAEAERSETCLD